MMQSNYYHHYCLSQLLKKGLLVIFISLPILGISATTTIDENNFNVLEQQQSRKLSGVVTDDNGEPLIGLLFYKRIPRTQQSLMQMVDLLSMCPVILR